MSVVWEGRGIWVWGFKLQSDPAIGPLQIRNAFRNFSEIGLNFILFLVKSDSGWLFYNSSIGPVDSRYGWDPLKVAVEEAHNFGLELHAWFCVFRDIRLANVTRPDLAMISIDGERSEEWVCPRNEEVRMYVKSLIAEVVSKYNVDGVHVDYIRYPNRTYCYCDRCRQNWIIEHPEIPCPPDPNNPEWIRVRQNVITSFIEETRMMIKGMKPNIKLSAAVYPIPDDAINNRMQNYPEWAEKGIIDFITPMTYTDKPSLFGDWLKQILRAVKGKTLVYPGIGLYKFYELSNATEILIEQINKTRCLNLTVDCLTLKTDGYVLFRYKFLNQFIETIKQLNGQKAQTPHSEEFPPEIGEPNRQPKEVEPLQTVNITVNVIDYPTRVRSVTLWYKANNGTWWSTTIKQTCQNTYQATIPGYEYCTWIHYKIEAYDIVGNKAVKEESYHVIPEFTSDTITLSIMIISAITIALIRRKCQTKEHTFSKRGLNVNASMLKY
ncbi:MAG: glycoside hydrolase family 10 protein [Candidatus Bathyarchaeia archaeon]